MRRNLYAAVNLADKSVIPTRYEIASKISTGAYISHHSAFEFHGVANQVFYEVIVSSPEKMNTFVFNGITYVHHQSSFSDGVIQPPYNPLVRVADIERTVVDSIKDLDLAGGVEEVFECIRLIPQLFEDKLVSYLEMYDLKSLWQRAGFILQQFQQQLAISDDFLMKCKSKIGTRKNYLTTDDDSTYSPEWQLYVPGNIFELLSEGGSALV